MIQQEISKLLNISDRTLRSWKKTRTKLYCVLERLDYEKAEEFLLQDNDEHIVRLLENQKYFTDYRSFERELFKFLVSGLDTKSLKKLSKDTNLSKEARVRSAYLYSFLTRKPLKLSFVLGDKKVGLYHGNKNRYPDGLARFYGMITGVDMRRFNQYKTTGTN